MNCWPQFSHISIELYGTGPACYTVGMTEPPEIPMTGVGFSTKPVNPISRSELIPGTKVWVTYLTQAPILTEVILAPESNSDWVKLRQEIEPGEFVDFWALDFMCVKAE